MNVQELLVWGRTRNYPQLVLDRERHQVLCAGERSWARFLLVATCEDLSRMIERIQAWKQREGEVRHASTL